MNSSTSSCFSMRTNTPPVEFVHQHPFVRQQPERLAQGVARHIQGVTDGLLLEPFAGPEVSFLDPFPQDLGDQLGGAAALKLSPCLLQVGQLRCANVRTHRCTSVPPKPRPCAARKASSIG